MSAKFNWLIMSNHKNDIRFIDATSVMWGCLTYFHKVKQTGGSNLMHYRDGKLSGYSIVMQAADDFSRELEELKQNTMSFRTEEPVAVENCREM